MEVGSATGSAEVVSFSARQVDSLLSALELHHERLQAAQEDARNLLVRGVRPAYVLDFELIFKYAFRVEERPDWAGELQYLLDRPQIEIFIGPGTKVEIQKFIYAIGYIIDPGGTPVDVNPKAGQERVAYGLEPESIEFGMARLVALLGHPNVTDLPYRPHDAEDEKAFAVARVALDLRRSAPERATANWADASNWTAVLQFRRHGADGDLDCHPYLLTATTHLLEERSWNTTSNDQVSRRPCDAIYTEVLLDAFPDPTEAIAHTRETVFHAARLSKGLQTSPAYLNPNKFREDPALDRAVEANLVGEELQRQLADIAEFVKDPVVELTQRIYDNVRLASVSAARRQGIAPELLGGESPRKLFDLIVEVSAALNAGGGTAVLGDLWRTALDLKVDAGRDWRSFGLTERSSVKGPAYFLSGEHYSELPGEEGVPEQYVFRWPTALDGDELVEAFSGTYSRGNVDQVDLVVGAETGVELFEAKLPLTLAGIVNAFKTAAREGDPESPVGVVRWVRMGSPGLGLYADVCSSDLTREPLVGVFAATVEPDQLEDLYFRTSSRYLLPAWLRRALEEIRDGKK